MRSSETNYIGSTIGIGIFLYLDHQTFGKNLRCLNLVMGIFLYLSNQAFGNKLRWFETFFRHITLYSTVRPSETKYVRSNLAIGLFPYLANQVFGNKLRCFNSLYRHVSLCSPSIFRKQTTLVQTFLSAYFSM
jgi:hypothetical protein